MDCLVTRRLPCSVCGLDTLRHHGWFLVLENRWLDRLRILSWYPSLAAQKDVQSACCRQHLRTLIVHWLNQDSLRPAPQADDPGIPITWNRARTGPDFDSNFGGHLVGELSVHRETFSPVWTGSPAALECILDALVPVSIEDTAPPLAFQLFGSSRESPHELPIY